jgi:hypothetical protein
MTIRVTCPSQASHRARGGNLSAEAQLGRTGVRADPEEVLGVDLHDDLRLVPAQDRQVARGELVVAQLHERVGLPLGLGPVVPGTPPGLDHRLQRGLHLLQADRVEVEPTGAGPVGVLDDYQPASLRGVGLGTVRVQHRQIAVHRLVEHLVRLGGGDRGQRRVDFGQVDVLLGGRSQALGLGDPAEHRGLLPGDLTGGERRGHAR